MNRTIKSALIASALLALPFLTASPAAAVVQYNKVCDQLGAGYVYIPGTNACTNLKDINHYHEQDNDGIAIGFAMETPVLPAGKNFGISGGVGAFNHSTALSMSGAYRIKDDLTISGGFGIGSQTGAIGGRAGFSYAW